MRHDTPVGATALETLEIAKEYGVTAEYVMAAAQIVASQRIGDALDRIADSLELEAIEVQTIRQAAVKVARSQVPDCCPSQIRRALEALDEFFSQPLTPRPGSPGEENPK